MDYEIKYKIALENARQFSEHPLLEDSSCIVEYLFPELKESKNIKDEKIRKAITEMIRDTTGDSLWIDYDVHKEDAIAWLEKQGKQECHCTGIGESKESTGVLKQLLDEEKSWSK